MMGYDASTKSFVTRGFENDGTVSTGSATVNGNTWRTTGTRRDTEGRVYKTRSTDTYSSDGQTITFATEYSKDDGKTWLPLWKGKMKKVLQ